MMPREHHRRRSPEAPGRRRDERREARVNLHQIHNRNHNHNHDHNSSLIPSSIPAYREPFPQYQQYQQPPQQQQQLQQLQQLPQEPYQRSSYQEPSRELFQPPYQPDPSIARDHERDRGRDRALSGGYSSSDSFTSSTSSSLLNISRPTKKFGFGSFFSGGASKHQRRVKKKRSKLLRFGNSSSSSVGSDLAYGRGYIERRRSRDFSPSSGRRTSRRGSDEKRRPPKRVQSEEEIIELGRQFAEIAKQHNTEDHRASGRSRGSKFAGASTALKQSRRSKSTTLNRGVASSKSRRDSSSDDSEWESTSSDDESTDDDVDSGLAYGSAHSLSSGAGRPTHLEASSRSAQAHTHTHTHAHAHSHSLSQSHSHTYSHAYSQAHSHAYSYSHDITAERKSSHVDPKLFGPVNSLRGFVQTPCGFGPADHNNTGNTRLCSQLSIARSDTVVSAEGRSLQYVYPVPTADPSRVDVDRGSIISAADSTTRSRPQPVPIQQPKPIAPVHAKVFESVDTDAAYSKRSSPPSIELQTSGVGRSDGSVGPTLGSDAAIGALLRTALRGRSKLQEARADSRQRLSQRTSEEEHYVKNEKSDSHEASRDVRSESALEQNLGATRYYEREKLRREQIEFDSGRGLEQRSRRHDEYRDDLDRAENVQGRRDDLTSIGQVVRRESRREERREAQVIAQKPKVDIPARLEQPSAAQPKVPIDPFQFQVADDAFPTPRTGTPLRPLTPVIVSVHREPVFSDDESYERLSRKDSFERELKRTQAAAKTISKSNIPETTVSESKVASASTAVVEKIQESSTQLKDPILDDADRAYREVHLARRLREEEARSRIDSSLTSGNVSAAPVPAVPALVINPAKQKSPYDAPNADVRIDNVLEDPREISRFRISESRRRSATLPTFGARDPSAERERPMLNVVRPTPAPSPAIGQQQSKESYVSSYATKEETTIISSETKDEVTSTAPAQTSRNVSWGENQTKHYVVESPEVEVEEDHYSESKIITSPETSKRRINKSKWGAITATLAAAGVTVAASSKASGSAVDSEKDPDDKRKKKLSLDFDDAVYAAPPIPGPKPAKLKSSQTTGGFAEDLEFMANIAAGLEGSGFDPNIIIDDAKFHRRDSPPGSNDPAVPSVSETTLRFRLSDRQKEVTSGEVREIAAEEHDKVPEKSKILSQLSRNESLKEEKVASEDTFKSSVMPVASDSSSGSPRSISDDDWDIPTRKSGRKGRKRREKTEIQGDWRSELVLSDSLPLRQEPEPITEDWVKDKKSSWLKTAVETREGSSSKTVGKPVYTGQVDHFSVAPEAEWGTSSKGKRREQRGRKRQPWLDEPRQLLTPEASALSRDSSFSILDSEQDPVVADFFSLSEKGKENERTTVDADYLRRSTDISDRSTAVEERFAGERFPGPAPKNSDIDDRDPLTNTEERPHLPSRRTTFAEDIVARRKDILESSDKSRSDQSPVSEEEWEDLPKSKSKKKRPKRAMTAPGKSSSSVSRSASYADVSGRDPLGLPKDAVVSPPRSVPVPDPRFQELERKREGLISAPSGFPADGSSNEGKLLEKEKGSNESKSEWGLGGTNLFGRLKSTIGYSGEKAHPETAKEDNSSFLANAGALGASAGIVGAVAALTQKRSVQKATDTATEAESLEMKPIEHVSNPPSPIDPEIVERKIRPAIDPRYGDLLPLPPSRSVTPLPSLDDQGFPPLPESRPGTPEDERERLLLSQKSPHHRRRSDSALKLKTPSPGSIPIRFRLGRGGTPVSPIVTTPESASGPKPRMRPISWESSKDFKPLLLVEKTTRSPSSTTTPTSLQESHPLHESPEDPRDKFHATPIRLGEPLLDPKYNREASEAVSRVPEWPRLPRLSPVPEPPSPTGSIDVVSKHRSSYLLHSSSDVDVSEPSPTLRPSEVRALLRELKETTPGDRSDDAISEHHDTTAEFQHEVLLDMPSSDKPLVLGETIDTREKTAASDELRALPVKSENDRKSKNKSRGIESLGEEVSVGAEVPVGVEVSFDTDDMPDPAWSTVDDQKGNDSLAAPDVPKKESKKKRKKRKQTRGRGSAASDQFTPMPAEEKGESSADVIPESKVGGAGNGMPADAPIESLFGSPTMPSIEAPTEPAAGTLLEIPFEVPSVAPIEAPAERSVAAPTPEIPTIVTEPEEKCESQPSQHEADHPPLSILTDSRGLEQTMPPTKDEGFGSAEGAISTGKETPLKWEQSLPTAKDTPSTWETEPESLEMIVETDNQIAREVQQSKTETQSSKTQDENVATAPFESSLGEQHVEFDEISDLPADLQRSPSDVLQPAIAEPQPAPERVKPDYDSQYTSPSQLNESNKESSELAIGVSQSRVLSDVDEFLAGPDASGGVEADQRPKPADAPQDPHAEVASEARDATLSRLPETEPSGVPAGTAGEALMPSPDQLAGAESSQVVDQPEESQTKKKGKKKQWSNLSLSDIQGSPVSLPTPEDVQEQPVGETSSAGRSTDARPIGDNEAIEPESTTLADDGSSLYPEKDRKLEQTFGEPDATVPEEVVKSPELDDNAILGDQNAESEKSTARPQVVPSPTDISSGSATLREKGEKDDQGENLSVPTETFDPSQVEAEADVPKRSIDFAGHDLHLSSPSTTETDLPVQSAIPELEPEVEPVLTEKGKETAYPPLATDNDATYPSIEPTPVNIERDVIQPRDITGDIPLSSIPDTPEQVEDYYEDVIAPSTSTEKPKRGKKKKKRPSVHFADPIDEISAGDAIGVAAPELTEPDEEWIDISDEPTEAELDFIEAQPVNVDPATVALPEEDDGAAYLPQEGLSRPSQPSIGLGQSSPRHQKSEVVAIPDQNVDSQARDALHTAPQDNIEAADIAQQGDTMEPGVTTDTQEKFVESVPLEDQVPPEAIPGTEDAIPTISEEEPAATPGKPKKDRKKRKSKSAQAGQETASDSAAPTIIDREVPIAQDAESTAPLEPMVEPVKTEEPEPAEEPFPFPLDAYFEFEPSETAKTEAPLSIEEPVPSNASSEAASKKSKKRRSRKGKGVSEIVPTTSSDESPSFAKLKEQDKSSDELQQPIQEGQGSPEESKVPPKALEAQPEQLQQPSQKGQAGAEEFNTPTKELEVPLDEPSVGAISVPKDEGRSSQDDQETGAHVVVLPENEPISLPKSGIDDLDRDVPVTLPTAEPEQYLEAPAAEEIPSKPIAGLSDKFDAIRNVDAQSASDVIPVATEEAKSIHSPEMSEEKAVPIQDVEADSQERALPHPDASLDSATPAAPVDIEKSMDPLESSESPLDLPTIEEEVTPEVIESRETTKNESRSISLDDEPVVPEPEEKSMETSTPAVNTEDSEPTISVPLEESRENDAADPVAADTTEKDEEEKKPAPVFNEEISVLAPDIAHADVDNADQDKVEEAPTTEANPVPAPSSKQKENESSFSAKPESFPGDGLPKSEDTPKSPSPTASEKKELAKKWKTFRGAVRIAPKIKDLIERIQARAEQSGAVDTPAAQIPEEKSVAPETTVYEDVTPVDTLPTAESGPSHEDATGVEVIPQVEKDIATEVAGYEDTTQADVIPIIETSPRHEDVNESVVIPQQDSDVAAPVVSQDEDTIPITDGRPSNKNVTGGEVVPEHEKDIPAEIAGEGDTTQVEVIPITENSPIHAGISGSESIPQVEKDIHDEAIGHEEATPAGVIPITGSSPSYDDVNEDGIIPESEKDIAAEIPGQEDIPLVETVPTVESSPIVEDVTGVEAIPQQSSDIADDGVPLQEHAKDEGEFREKSESHTQPSYDQGPLSDTREYMEELENSSWADELLRESTDAAAEVLEPIETVKSAPESAHDDGPANELPKDLVPEDTSPTAVADSSQPVNKPTPAPETSINDGPVGLGSAKQNTDDSPEENLADDSAVAGPSVVTVPAVDESVVKEPLVSEPSNEDVSTELEQDVSKETALQEEPTQEKSLQEDLHKNVLREELPMQDTQDEIPQGLYQELPQEETLIEVLQKEDSPLLDPSQVDLPEEDTWEESLLLENLPHDLPKDDLPEESLSQEDAAQENASQLAPTEEQPVKDLLDTEVPQEDLREEDTPKEPTPADIPRDEPQSGSVEVDLSRDDAPRVQEPLQEGLSQELLAEPLPLYDMLTSNLGNAHLPHNEAPHEAPQEPSREGLSQEKLPVEPLPQIDMPESDLADADLPRDDGPEDFPHEDLSKVEREPEAPFKEESTPEVLPPEELANDDLAEEILPQEDTPQEPRQEALPKDLPQDDILQENISESGLAGTDLSRDDAPQEQLRESSPKKDLPEDALPQEDISDDLIEAHLPRDDAHHEPPQGSPLKEELTQEDPPRDDVLQEHEPLQESLPQEYLPVEVLPVEVPPQEDVPKSEFTVAHPTQDDTPREPLLGSPTKELTQEDLLLDDTTHEPLKDSTPEEVLPVDTLPREDLSEDDLEEHPPKEDLPSASTPPSTPGMRPAVEQFRRPTSIFGLLRPSIRSGWPFLHRPSLSLGKRESEDSPQEIPEEAPAQEVPSLETEPEEESPQEAKPQDGSHEGDLAEELHEDLPKEESPVEDLPQEDVRDKDTLEDEPPRDNVPRDSTQADLSQENLFQEESLKDTEGQPREELLQEPRQGYSPVEDSSQQVLISDDASREDLPAEVLTEEVSHEGGPPESVLPEEEQFHGDLPREDLTEYSPTGDLPRELLEENTPKETSPLGELTQDYLAKEDLLREDASKEGPSQDELSQNDLPHENVSRELPQDDLSQEPSQETPLRDKLPQELVPQDLPKDASIEAPSQGDMPEEDLSQELQQENPPREEMPQELAPEELTRQESYKEDVPKDPSIETPSQRDLPELSTEIPPQDVPRDDLPRENPSEDLPQDSLPVKVPQEDMPKVDSPQALHQETPDLTETSELAQDTINPEEPGRVMLPQDTEAGPSSEPVTIPKSESEGSVINDDAAKTDGPPSESPATSTKKSKKKAKKKKKKQAASKPDQVEESARVPEESIPADAPGSSKKAQVEVTPADSSQEAVTIPNEVNHGNKSIVKEDQTSSPPESGETPYESLPTQMSETDKDVSVGESELKPKPEVQPEHVPESAAAPDRAVEKGDIDRSQSLDQHSRLSTTEPDVGASLEAEAPNQDKLATAKPTPMEETDPSAQPHNTKESTTEPKTSETPTDALPELPQREYSFEDQQTMPEAADRPQEAALEEAPEALDDETDTGSSKKSKKDKSKKRASQVSWESGPDAEIGEVMPDSRQSEQTSDESRACEPTESHISGDAEDQFAGEHPSGKEFNKNTDHHSEMDWEMEPNREIPVEEPMPLPPTEQEKQHDKLLDHQSFAEDIETSLKLPTNFDDSVPNTTSSEESKREVSESDRETEPVTAAPKPTKKPPLLEQTVTDTATRLLDAPPAEAMETITDDRTIAEDTSPENASSEKSQENEAQAKEKFDVAQPAEIHPAPGDDATTGMGLETVDEPSLAKDTTDVLERPKLCPERGGTEEKPRDCPAGAGPPVEQAKEHEGVDRHYPAVLDQPSDTAFPSTTSESSPETAPDTAKEKITDISRREQPQEPEPSTETPHEVERADSGASDSKPIAIPGFTLPTWDWSNIDEEIQSEPPVEPVLPEKDPHPAELPVTIQPSDANIDNGELALDEPEPQLEHEESLITRKESEADMADSDHAREIEAPQSQDTEHDKESQVEAAPDLTIQVPETIDLPHDNQPSIEDDEPHEHNKWRETIPTEEGPLPYPVIFDELTQEPDTIEETISDATSVTSPEPSSPIQEPIEVDVPVQWDEQDSVTADNVPESWLDEPDVIEASPLPTFGSPPRTPPPNRRTLDNISRPEPSSYFEYGHTPDQATPTRDRVRADPIDDGGISSGPLPYTTIESPAPMPRKSDSQMVDIPAEETPSTPEESSIHEEYGGISESIVKDTPAAHSEDNSVNVNDPHEISDPMATDDTSLAEVDDKETEQSKSDEMDKGMMSGSDENEIVDTEANVELNTEGAIGKSDGLSSGDHEKVGNVEEEILEDDTAEEPVLHESKERKLVEDSQPDEESHDIPTGPVTGLDKELDESARAIFDSAPSELTGPAHQEISDSPESREIVPDSLAPETSIPHTEKTSATPSRDTQKELGSPERAGSRRGSLLVSPRDAPEESPFAPYLPPPRTPSVLDRRATPGSLPPVEEETREDLERELKSGLQAEHGEVDSPVSTPPPSEKRSRRRLFGSETPKLTTPTKDRTPEKTAAEEPPKRVTTPSKSRAVKYQDLITANDALPAMSPQPLGSIAGSVLSEISREPTPLDSSAPPPRPPSSFSISRFRTPEPHAGRTDSPSSHSIHSIYSAHSLRSLRSSDANTPPLRRRNRQMSGNLRSLSHSGSSTSLPGPTDKEKDKDDRDTNTIIRGGALDRSDRSDRSDRRPEDSSNTIPTANEGRVRAKDMTDIYDGYGEGRIGSPRSPTRPPSMRRRQSMQVIELESKVEQLLAENRALSDARAQAEQSLTQRSTSAISDRDAEIENLKASLQWLRNEVTRLTEVNEGLQSANNLLALQHNEKYTQLKSKQSTTARELEDIRSSSSQYTQSLQEKDAEIEDLRKQLEATKEQVREMQKQILAAKPPDADFLRLRDEDHFDHRCQQLCSHVQQWILRFSKFSDMRACRLTKEINDEKIVDRLDNTILDGSDVDDYLSDRVARRDIFMSMTMNMIWEFVFTRYLFGMDREQRQKLKSLEKLLTEVGPPHAVRQWRAITLTLLSRRPAFGNQRNQDTEAVVQAILHTLSMILPPPSNMEAQIQSQLRRVMREAVDLSIEMRTHRAEYIMLPPTQPEYDANGELTETVAFNAALMHERSGDATMTNEAYENQHAIVRCVLFPLVAKKGDDNGVGDEEIVVYPAQVLVAKARRSTIRLVTPTSDAGGTSVSRNVTPSAVSNIPDAPLTPEYV